MWLIPAVAAMMGVTIIIPVALDYYFEYKEKKNEQRNSKND